MDDKLDHLEHRYDELQQKIADPAVINDHVAYRDTMKSISEISDIVTKYRQLKQIRKSIADTRGMLATLKGEDELRELAELELHDLEARQPGVENDLRVLLQPKDPNDEKNVFVEIRAGTGRD